MRISAARRTETKTAPGPPWAGFSGTRSLPAGSATSAPRPGAGVDRTAFTALTPTATFAPSPNAVCWSSSGGRRDTRPAQSPDRPPQGGAHEPQRATRESRTGQHPRDRIPRASPGPARRPARGNRPATGSLRDRHSHRPSPRPADPDDRHLQLSAVESVVAECASTLPQEQGPAARLTGERVGTARATEVHGGAVIRSFLKLHDERHRASTRGAGGGLITLNPGGDPSKLPKHGRFGAITSRRPGFTGQVIVVLGLLLQVDGPDIAEHEQSFLGDFGAGQRLKAIQWEEQGAVPSRDRLPVAAHAWVVLAGEQGKDSAPALRCPSFKVTQDDLGEELHRAFTRRAARPFSACGGQGHSTRPTHQRVRRRWASVDHQGRHDQDSRSHR